MSRQEARDGGDGPITACRHDQVRQYDGKIGPTEDPW